MVQNIIVGVILIAAVFYVARLIYRNFTSKSACESGCGKCGALDVDKIERQLKQRNF
jgi:hypothetical protein